MQSLGCPYTVQFDKGRMIQNLLFVIIQAIRTKVNTVGRIIFSYFPSIRIHEVHGIPGAVGVGGDVVVLLSEGVGGGPAGVGGGEEARAKVVGTKALVPFLARPLVGVVELYLGPVIDGLPVRVLVVMNQDLVQDAKST